MKKLLLILFIGIICSLSMNAQEIVNEQSFKSCKEVDLYSVVTEKPSSIKMNKDDKVYILCKKGDFIYVKYAKTKYAVLFKVKIDDIKDCEINFNIIKEL